MQVHLRLDKELGTQLDAYCKAYGYSKGKLISRLLKKHIDDASVPRGEPSQEPAGGPISGAQPLPQPEGFLARLRVREAIGVNWYLIDEIATELGLHVPDMTQEIDTEDLNGDYTNLTGLITALGVAKRQGKDVTEFEAMLRTMGIEP